MIEFLQMVLSGIAVGSSYAFMGLGMVLIYKSSEVPNFVQGEMALLPVFITYMILETYGFPLYVAFAGCVHFFGFFGMLSGICSDQKGQRTHVIGLIIITIGLEMVLLGFVSWKFGADPRSMPFPISSYDSIAIGDIFISTLDLLTLSMALILMLIFFSSSVFQNSVWP